MSGATVLLSYLAWSGFWGCMVLADNAERAETWPKPRWLYAVTSFLMVGLMVPAFVISRALIWAVSRGLQ